MSEDTSAAEIAAPQDDVEIHDVDVKNVADRLGPPQKTFTVAWTDHANNRVVGTFTAVRPNIAQVGQIAITRARLNQGERLDPSTDYLHQVLAFLSVTLKDPPKEWQPDLLFDVSPIIKVHGHVEAWLKTFRGSSLG